MAVGATPSPDMVDLPSRRDRPHFPFVDDAVRSLGAAIQAEGGVAVAECPTPQPALVSMASGGLCPESSIHRGDGSPVLADAVIMELAPAVPVVGSGASGGITGHSQTLQRAVSTKVAAGAA